MAEPTVQVPVSLILTVRAAMDVPNLSWSTRQDICRRLDALIAQPTEAELSEQMHRYMVENTPPALLSQPTPTAGPTVGDVPYVEPGDPRLASVPARVIWDVLNQVWDALTTDITGPLVEALSQPTPTAEPFDSVSASCASGPRAEQDEENAAPPSIADMVPGTTFTAKRVADGVAFRWRWDDEGLHMHSILGWMLLSENADAIDPSTIRDVTPPGAAQ